MSEIVERKMLQVVFTPDPADLEYVDSVEAYRVSDTFAPEYPYWHVGGKNTANYISIYQSDIDGWIELLTAMKNYKEETSDAQ